MVKTLERGPLGPGKHRIAWDGRDDRGRPVAPGVYFYQLVSSDGVQKRSMLLLR
jgi:flagellar hook assembly protein FlgD